MINCTFYRSLNDLIRFNWFDLKWWLNFKIILLSWRVELLMTWWYISHFRNWHILRVIRIVTISKSSLVLNICSIATKHMMIIFHHISFSPLCLSFIIIVVAVVDNILSSLVYWGIIIVINSLLQDIIVWRDLFIINLCLKLLFLCDIFALFIFTRTNVQICNIYFTLKNQVFFL